MIKRKNESVDMILFEFHVLDFDLSRYEHLDITYAVYIYLRENKEYNHSLVIFFLIVMTWLDVKCDSVE